MIIVSYLKWGVNMKKQFLLFLCLISLSKSSLSIGTVDPEICAICQSELPGDLSLVASGDQIFGCSPEHKYCSPCLGDWCRHRDYSEGRTPSCPLCRQDLDSHGSNSSESEESQDLEVNWSELVTSDEDGIESSEGSIVESEPEGHNSVLLHSLMQEMDGLDLELYNLREVVLRGRHSANLAQDPFLSRLERRVVPAVRHAEVVEEDDTDLGIHIQSMRNRLREL